MPLLSTHNLLRFREGAKNARPLGKPRIAWKFFLPLLWMLALWGGGQVLPSTQQTAETSVVMIPESMYLTIPQTIGLVPTQVDPAPLLASLMGTQEMRARIHKSYQALCAAKKLKALPNSDYTLHFLPQEDQVTLTLRVQAPGTLAVQQLADIAAQTTLAVYQERMNRFVPQLRRQLVAVLQQTELALGETQKRLVHVKKSIPAQRGTKSVHKSSDGFIPVSFRPASSSLQVLKDQLERIEVRRPAPPLDHYTLLRDQEWQEARIATLEHQLDNLAMFELQHKTLARLKSGIVLKEKMSWDRVWILSCLILLFTGTLPLLLRKEQTVEHQENPLPPVKGKTEADIQDWDLPPVHVETVFPKVEPSAPEAEADIPLESEPLSLIHRLPVTLPEASAFLEGMQQDPVLMKAFSQLVDDLALPSSVKILAISQEPRVAAGLAMSMAKPGTSVCVVDCHVHDPSLHTLFGVDNDWGLAELLQAPAQTPEILNKALLKNPLVVFTAGKFYEVSLSAFEEFSPLIEAIVAEVSYVILNLPPLEAAEELERLLGLSKADGLLVCGERFESPELISALSQQLPIPWIRLLEIGDGMAALSLQ